MSTRLIAPLPDAVRAVPLTVIERPDLTVTVLALVEFWVKKFDPKPMSALATDCTKSTSPFADIEVRETVLPEPVKWFLIETAPPVTAPRLSVPALTDVPDDGPVRTVNAPVPVFTVPSEMLPHGVGAVKTPPPVAIVPEPVILPEPPIPAVRTTPRPEPVPVIVLGPRTMLRSACNVRMAAELGAELILAASVISPLSVHEAQVVVMVTEVPPLREVMMVATDTVAELAVGVNTSGVPASKPPLVVPPDEMVTSDGSSSQVPAAPATDDASTEPIA